MSTGYYYQRFHPRGEVGSDPGPIAELLIDEVTGGLLGVDGEHTGFFPGVLGEIGSHGPEASPQERASLRAAGRVAAATGLSVGTHAHLGQGGLEQLGILIAEGVDPGRISIGHQDLLDGTDQQRRIAQTGAYVAFDTVGKESYQPDSVRLRMALELIEAGYERRILLSNDISRNSYLLAWGGHGYRHVLTTFRDSLVHAGVGSETLDVLYRRNPLRWLTGEDQ
jgi:phosphotriesterase-related protein